MRYSVMMLIEERGGYFKLHPQVHMLPSSGQSQT